MTMEQLYELAMSLSPYMASPAELFAKSTFMPDRQAVRLSIMIKEGRSLRM